MKKFLIGSLILSIFLNTVCICYIIKQGIVINHYTTNHQEQYQQQWQGQLLINQWTSQGNSLEWKYIECNYEDLTKELNKLHPISSLYAKIQMGNINHVIKYYIYYPDIFTKINEVKK